MLATAAVLARRSLYLFTVGVAFAFVLNLLQRQRQVTIFPPGVFGDILNSAWWVPPACGLAAGKPFGISKV